MTRVLYLDPAPFAGGAQESLLAAVLALKDEEQLCLFGSGLAGRATQAGLECQPIATRHWPATPAGFFDFWQDSRKTRAILRQAIQDFHPDCIHANTLRAALLLCLLPSVPPVLLHDRDLRSPTLIRRFIVQRLQPDIVAISSQVAQCWQGICPRVTVLPNGFDCAAIAATPPMNWCHGSFAVMQTADLEPWKGHSLFLKAIALAAAKCPGLRALIKGRLHTDKAKNYLHSLLQERKHLGLDSVVEINTEPVSALPFLASSHLAVACSSQEPFGRTIVEALALGKPVAATRGAGTPELFQDNPAATLCAPEPEALAEHILAWQDSLKRSSISTAATAFARHFSLEAHADALRSLHQSKRKDIAK